MRSKSLTRTILQPIGIAVALGLTVRAAVHIYSIPSESMAPTLAVGDQIVVTRYIGHEPQRGHIIVFRSPVTPDELLVKRVVAVPGDLIDSRLGRVRIAGHTLPEPYVLREAATGAIESQTVPPDTYFVLGDNRDESLDSRNWGVVPRSTIVGRARMILWSSPVDADDAARASTSAQGAPPKSSEPRRCLFKWLS
jgi:signal peptidase I